MKNIDATFSQFSNQTPGCAVAVIKNDEIVFENYYGLANVEKKEKITASTAFRLASLTKPFTAMAIMMLVEKGFLQYEDTIPSFFPDFPIYGNTITIRQLLSHTSGMPDHESPLYQKIKPGEEPTIYDSLEILKQQKNTYFKPGSTYKYSDAGYVLLALLIEKVSGKRYADFLNERIFIPLDMNYTVVLDETKPEIKHRALGYKKTPAGYELWDYDPLNYIIGDEGIYSTPRDLAKWIKAWQSEILVSKKALQNALSSALLENDKESRCGFSWFLQKINGKEYIFHDGFWVGFTNVMLTENANKTTVIVLSNTNLYDSEEKRINLAIKIAELYDNIQL